MEVLAPYIDQYGYIFLFFYLMLDLIALPLPGQSLMAYVGFLAYRGHMDLGTSILIAILGSCVGMTITYFLGYKIGNPLLKKYGRFIRISPKRVEKTSEWYGRHGSKLLAIGYFIPGVRHFTGYLSGVAKLRFRTFAIFAYSGAIVWTSTFILFGNFLGPQWDALDDKVKNSIIITAIIVFVSLIFVYLFRKYFGRVLTFLMGLVRRVIDWFKTSES